MCSSRDVLNSVKVIHTTNRLCRVTMSLDFKVLRQLTFIYFFIKNNNDIVIVI